MVHVILNILISAALKTLFSWLYPKIDVELYQKKFEARISKGISCGKFWDWLFTVKDIGSFKNAVPYYRVFQKSIIVIYWGAAAVFFYLNFPFYIFLIDVIGGVFLGAYYWMLYERKYYTMAGQEKHMYEYQVNKVDVYWLKRIYFSGYWLFRNGFTGWKFDLSAVIGLVILYLTSLIYLIK
jgi:hypothetical protein